MGNTRSKKCTKDQLLANFSAKSVKLHARQLFKHKTKVVIRAQNDIAKVKPNNSIPI